MFELFKYDESHFENELFKILSSKAEKKYCITSELLSQCEDSVIVCDLKPRMEESISSGFDAMKKLWLCAEKIIREGNKRHLVIILNADIRVALYNNLCNLFLQIIQEKFANADTHICLLGVKLERVNMPNYAKYHLGYEEYFVPESIDLIREIDNALSSLCEKNSLLYF